MGHMVSGNIGFIKWHDTEREETWTQFPPVALTGMIQVGCKSLLHVSKKELFHADED